MPEHANSNGATRHVFIAQDEWWPVYTIEYEDPTVELPEEFIARFELAAAEFEECQVVLREAYKNAR